MIFKAIAIWGCPHAIGRQLIQPGLPLITLNKGR